MTEKKYIRLKKLTKKVRSFNEFIEEIAKSTFWYGIPYYSKKDYQIFYDRYKTK